MAERLTAPPVSLGAPGVWSVERALLEAAAADEMTRLRRYAQAWRYYSGDHDEPLVVLPGNPNDNVLVNLAGLVVDKGASYLFGQDFQVTHGDDPDDSPIAMLWKRTMRRSGGLILWKDAAVNGGVTGHSFLRIIRQPGEAYDRLVTLDPSNVTVHWDPDDVSVAVGYTVAWSTVRHGKAVAVRHRHLPTGTGQWIILHEESTGANGRWLETKREAWPYPFPAIVDNKNAPLPNVYYGLADIEYDVLHLNDVVNRAHTNLNKIVRHHARPTTWARGISDAQAIEVSPSGILVLPDKESHLANLEMATNLAQVQSFADAMIALFHEVTRVPEVATGRLDNIGQLSGVALQIMYEPLLEKTRTKRELYGATIREAFYRLATIRKVTCDPDEVEVTWPDMLPQDEKEQAEAAAAWQAAGVSKRTTLERAGFDPDQETERLDEEAETGARRFNAGTSSPYPPGTPDPDAEADGEDQP